MRTLGKRVIRKDSRVRIPVSPPNFALKNLARSRQFVNKLTDPLIWKMYCKIWLSLDILNQNGGRDLDNLVTNFRTLPLNEIKTRTYAGVSDAFHKRLEEHNLGIVKSLFLYRPYLINPLLLL